MVRYVLSIFIMISFSIELNSSDLLERFQKMMRFIQSSKSNDDLNYVEIEHVAQKILVRGRLGSTMVYYLSTHYRFEKICISDTAQPHHFLCTPIYPFLDLLYKQLEEQESIELPIEKGFWRFKQEETRGCGNTSHVIGHYQK